MALDSDWQLHTGPMAVHTRWMTVHTVRVWVDGSAHRSRMGMQIRRKLLAPEPPETPETLEPNAQNCNPIDLLTHLPGHPSLPPFPLSSLPPFHPSALSLKLRRCS
eukprot:3859452-Rhodomonas_salina.4